MKCHICAEDAICGATALFLGQLPNFREAFSDGMRPIRTKPFALQCQGAAARRRFAQGEEYHAFRFERRHRHRGRGPVGHLHCLGSFGKRRCRTYRHRREGARYRGPLVSESENGPLRRLRALSHHYGLLGRRRFFRRQAFAVVRGGRRFARIDRRTPRPRHHRTRRRHIPAFRRRYARGGRGRSRRGEGNPPPRHSGGPEAGGLPDPPFGHREGAGNLRQDREPPA